MKSKIFLSCVLACALLGTAFASTSGLGMLGETTVSETVKEQAVEVVKEKAIDAVKDKATELVKKKTTETVDEKAEAALKKSEQDTIMNALTGK